MPARQKRFLARGGIVVALGNSSDLNPGDV
jgi:hypothetical protein